MLYKLLVILYLALCIGIAVSRSPSLPPPQWSSIWMTSGSAFNLYTNETISAQIYYNWQQRSQVMNLMRSDSYTYTILNIENTVGRLERANRTCCIDPQQTGVSPPRPGNNNKNNYR